MNQQQRAPRGASASERIATDIRERIATGEYNAGDLIPSERELTETYNVAKMTASRAVGRLKSEGLVQTQPGRGLVVLDRRAGMSPASQLERMRSTGRIRLPNERTKVIQTGERPSAAIDPMIVAALGQTEESGPVLYRRRLILRDEQPMCIATSWIGATVLSHQPRWEETRERLLSYDLVPGGTPALIAQLVGEDIEREDYIASAEAATVMEADLLGLKVGSPVLMVISTVHGSQWPLEVGVYTHPAGLRLDFPSLVLPG